MTPTVGGAHDLEARDARPRAHRNETGLREIRTEQLKCAVDFYEAKALRPAQP
jgi:hypothetical protein